MDNAKVPAISISEELSARLQGERSKLHEAFFTSFQRANVKLDPEALTKEIISQLTKERREIVLKLLGFDERYCGKLEVNACNSRDKDSIVGQFLRKEAAAAVQKWLETEMLGALDKHIAGKFSDPKVMKAAQQYFDSQFDWKLRAAMEAQAGYVANELAQGFAAQVKETMKLSEFK